MKDWKASTREGLAEYRKFVTDRDAAVSAFLHFSPKERNKTTAASETAEQKPLSNSNNYDNNSLEDLPYAVKDNIAVKQMPLSCGSKFLENFVSPYDATVITRLSEHGAVPAGKTNMDEFGMGSSGDNSALQQSHNPWDLSRVCGGSSGGSAAAVAAGLVPFALGSDTGGSVRQPAAFCGIYGLKPSYGSVSRYGLVAYASSLDVIGVMAADIDITRDVFHAIRGRDEMDQSSVDYRDFPVEKERVKTIGILTGELGLSEEMGEAYGQAVEHLQKAGYELKEVEMPSLEYTVPSYYTIATAEASANLARFNGVRYGERPIFAENPDELVRKSRDAGFGDEVKLRILLGTYVLRSGFQDRFYQKAQQIRTEIRREFRELFESVDTLMLPVFPTQAFPHGELGLDAFQQKISDRFTTAANLTGLPGLSVPGPLLNNLPTAVQFMAPAFHEHLLFECGESLGGSFPIQNPGDFPPEYRLERG